MANEDAHPWPRGTGKNFGEVDPDAPPPQVAHCKSHAHVTDSFVIHTERGGFENYTCNVCRLIWREPLVAED